MLGAWKIGALVATGIMGVSIVGPASGELKAEVRSTSSGPKLYINGQPTAPTMYWLINEHGQIKTAAKHGVKIVTLILWGMPWWQDDEEPDFSKHPLDGWVDAVLAENPDALLLPRVPVDQPAEWWSKEHPEEMMLFHDGTQGLASIHSEVWRRDALKQMQIMIRHLEEKYGDRIIGYHPCGQTSAEWFYYGMWEGKLPGLERPALDGFRSYLEDKYRTDEGLRRAWHDPDITFDTVDAPSVRDRTRSTYGAFRDPLIEQKVVDFDEFQNVAVADVVSLMCKGVKEVAPNKLAVAFYGYHFEVVGPNGLQSSGHLGMNRLLKSPYVDVISAPYSYVDRQPGGAGCLMAPVDSVLLNGKLWLTEDDTRTHKSDPEAGPGRCSNAEETKAVHLRNFSHMLTRGGAVWWSAFGGGDEMWAHLAALQEVYQESIPDHEPYAPEIAVIVDDRSCLYSHPSPLLLSTLLGTFRQQWYRIGAPVGMYLLDDLLAGKVPPAKMYVLLDTFRLDSAQLEAIRSRICKKGRTVVWMYAPGIVRGNRISPEYVEDVVGIKLSQTESGDGRLVLDGTPETFDAVNDHLTPSFAVDDDLVRVIARYEDGGEVAVAAKDMGAWTSVYCGALQLPSSVLRELAQDAGVHIYCDQDDVVMAGNGFVAVHASSEGKKTLRMPGECSLSDAITGDAMGNGRAFEFEMRKGGTRLFRVEDR